MRPLLVSLLKFLPDFLKDRLRPEILGQPFSQKVPEGLLQHHPAADGRVGARAFPWGQQTKADKLGHLGMGGVEAQRVGALEVVRSQDRLHFIWKADHDAQETVLFSLQFLAAAPGLLCLLKQPQQDPACGYGAEEGPEGIHAADHSAADGVRL